MGIHRWVKEFENSGITVVDCLSCGFKHQWPLPSHVELDKLYAELFYEGLKPQYIQETDDDKEWRDLQNGEKLRTFESFLGEQPTRQRRILDIGSSTGVFLQAFLGSGLDVLGIEPSRTAALVAQQRGIPTLINSIERVPAEELNGPFDAVNMREVLDHVLFPIDVLQKVHDELVVGGGVICIETGNEFNEFQLAVCEHYQISPWWICSDHINYFDRVSLENLLLEVGFEILLAEASYPLELFALQGDNYVGDPQIGRACHLKRLHFEKVMELLGKSEVKRKLYRALADVGLGRQIIVYARKRA